tara:strand:+ start:97 stop:1017 length:921 start_codon:yes stop_codon:yes gene_type:complete
MSTYSINILVIDGKKEGVKIYSRPVDWAGQIITFPKSLVRNVRDYVPESTNGVYILWSKQGGSYSVYVGKSDNIISRIQQHVDGKDFWTNALILISNGNILNSAHVGWIEANLVQKVKEISTHKILNGNQPADPMLNLHDKTLASTFLERLEEMLPITGLQLFDQFEEDDLDISSQNEDDRPTNNTNEINTLLVPTGKSGDGFEEVFLNEHAWYYLRISSEKLKKFKYIAAYQPAPVSAVTHFAEIEKFIEVENEKGLQRQKAIFKSPAIEIPPIPFGSARGGSMQGPRYVNKEELLQCTDLGGLL